MVVHAFNPSTQAAETGQPGNSRSAWSTQQVPDQPEPHNDTSLGFKGPFNCSKIKRPESKFYHGSAWRPKAVGAYQSPQRG